MLILGPKPLGRRLNRSLLTKVTGGGGGGFDADATAYIAAVETADGQTLEDGVKTAINDFVVGCKADGIWNAIKASCILSGARTLSGALVPLVGTAPTNNNFVTGDYNRKTGLIGNGSTKYLNSNRANNADPQNSQHLVVYASNRSSVLGNLIGDLTDGQTGYSYFYDVSGSQITSRSRGGSTEVAVSTSATGLIGINRSVSASYVFRSANTNTTINGTSATPSTGPVHVFRLNRSSGDVLYTNARLAFYSIGESLDLALLNARVTTLIAAYAAAIP